MVYIQPRIIATMKASDVVLGEKVVGGMDNPINPNFTGASGYPEDE
jgi:hypothetical protein